MKLPRHQRKRGIALIIVMIIILVLGAMAAMLALSMRTEARLARNSNWDTELEWLGRSGIELAKYVLSQPGQGGQAFDALNQKWAGGTGETNDALADISLTDNELGHGKFSVKIIDCDRKFNINMALERPEILNQALILMGVEATEIVHITESVQNWIKRPGQIVPGAVRSTDDDSFYMSLNPPYHIKEGPIDDLSEMLNIKGITPNMYFGSGAGAAASRSPVRVTTPRNKMQQDEPTYPIGFIDLFTTVSGRFININTASANVLQLIPDVDGSIAQAIITTRAGPDGVEGNEDDMPFRSIGELSNVPGLTPAMMGMFQRNFSNRSTTFEVEVEATIDNYKRTYHALLRRVNLGQIVTLYMWWQ